MDELAFGPLLSLPPDERQRLASRAREVRLRRGERLMSTGDPSDAAYAVTAGRVRVIGRDGTILATMSAPALAGELSVLLGAPRSASVVALDPVRALRIEAADLRAVAAAQQDFERTLAAFADARRANAFFRRQGPFTGLPSDEIEELAGYLRPVRLPVGAVLMRQGEPGDDVYLIRDGRLEVSREGAERRVIAHMSSGALVGEIAALTGSPRTATVRCETEVSALVVPGDRVRAVVERHAALLDHVRSVMQARHAPQRTADHKVETAPDDPEAVILHDEARGVYLRLDRQALGIYLDLDGERTLRDLALRHFERTGTLDPQAVFGTVAALQVSGFASAPRLAERSGDHRLIGVLDAILAPRAEIQNADAPASALYRSLAPLLTRPAAALAAVLGLGGLAAAFPVLRTASVFDFGIGGIVVAFAGLLFAGIGHEIAHALAAKAEGSRLGRAGIGLFWFTPVVYVDTSATWSIPRWSRIRVNAAGPLFNLAFAGLLGLAARAATGDAQSVLVWLSLTNVALVLFNLSPLLEFDGYYVLADLTDTNALRSKAMRFVFGDLARRPRLALSRREAGFLVYVGASLLYVLAASVVSLVGIPAFVNSVLPPSLGDAVRADTALLVGVVMAVLLVFPFISEALGARSQRELGVA